MITWNCQGGFAKKTDALFALNPDVAVIQECSEKSTTALQQYEYETLWFGSNPNKGMGVICRKGYSLHALPQSQQKWIVPIEVDAPIPFILIAVWACKSGTKAADDYIGQVYQALISHPEWFDGRPVVLAGDWNSNKQWDPERRVGNHSEVVKMLAERGLVSGYHEFFGETQGAESRKTIYLHRHAHRPYHIDYIFIPQEWMPRLKAVDVGGYEQWSKLSDHCPVIVDLGN